MSFTFGSTGVGAQNTQQQQQQQQQQQAKPASSGFSFGSTIFGQQQQPVTTTTAAAAGGGGLVKGFSFGGAALGQQTQNNAPLNMTPTATPSGALTLGGSLAQPAPAGGGFMFGGQQSSLVGNTSTVKPTGFTFNTQQQPQQQPQQQQQQQPVQALAPSNVPKPVAAAGFSFSGQPSAAPVQSTPAFSFNPQPPVATVSNNQSGFMFGQTPSSGFSFANSAVPTATTVPMTTNSLGGFSFGASATPVITTVAMPTATPGGFKFGTPTATTVAMATPAAGGFSFGASAVPTATTVAMGTPAAGGFSFGASAVPTVTTVAMATPAVGGFTFGAPSTATSVATATPSLGGFSFNTPNAPVVNQRFNLNSSISSTTQPPPSTTLLNFNKPINAAVPVGGFNPSAIPSQNTATPSLNLNPKPTVTMATTPQQTLSLTTSTAAPSTGFSLNPSISIAPSTGFSLNPSSSTAPTTGFSLNPSSSVAPTGFNLNPSISIAPSTGFSLNPSSSTAPSTGFNLNPISSTAPSTGFSLNSGVKPTPTASGFMLPGVKPVTTVTTLTTAAPSSGFSMPVVQPLTSIATTSTASLNIGSLTNTTTSTVSGTQPVTMTYRQLEESINKWTVDMEEQENMFLKVATEVNTWDRLLIDNGEKMSAMNEELERVKLDQERLDQDLDFIKSQQTQLEDLLCPLEESVRSQTVLSQHQHADVEREQTYQLAENIDVELKQIVQDLKDIIDNLNDQSTQQDTSNPMTQIAGILNHHMDTLQWIDQNSAYLQRKIEDVTKLCEKRKTEQERNYKLVFD